MCECRIGVLSPGTTNTRTACAANSYTTGVAGAGADAVADCLCGSGYYDVTGTCTVAGAGWYSAYRSDSRAQCSANYYGTSTTNSAATCTAACPTHSTSPAGSDNINDCDGDGGMV